jgi:hypothetical protein
VEGTQVRLRPDDVYLRRGIAVFDPKDDRRNVVSRQTNRSRLGVTAGDMESQRTVALMHVGEREHRHGA